jgi:hypothetical protein
MQRIRRASLTQTPLLVAVSKSPTSFILIQKQEAERFDLNRLHFERMSIGKPLHTLPFLSLHAIAASRGDGLRPEFVNLFNRLASGADPSLSEVVPVPLECGLDMEPDRQSVTQGQETPEKTDNHEG